MLTSQGMFLEKILINNFKNIEEAALTFSDRINCFSGNNGMGKSNLLDAIFYLSMARSYFGFFDYASIKTGSNMASVGGWYRMADSTLNNIVVALYGKNVAENKIVKCNGKAYKKLSEHIGLLPIVMISPCDVFLVSSGGEERRKFINQLLSQTDKEYLYKLQSYNKLLLQRNKLLKQEEGENLEVISIFNEKLSVAASYIYEARKHLAEQLNACVSGYYAQLSGGKERVRVGYESDLAKGELKALLEKNYERDKLLTYTSLGVHRDDFLFEISAAGSESYYPIKRYASQGQQKCFLIALKLSQFSIMRERCRGAMPILLLDDIFDKLDLERVGRLLKLVAGPGFGQIFITDSNKMRLEQLFEGIGAECKYFSVENGAIVEAV